MELSAEQLDLVIAGLIEQRKKTIGNGEKLILDYNNGRFKGKHFGPQNENGLNKLLDGYDLEVAQVNNLIELFENEREKVI